MIPASIQIREHLFELHPLRALWWHKHAILICADVHIGKGEHFRQSGIPIPKAVNASNLWNLVVLIEHYKPKKVLFLGDLFHSKNNREWAELIDCLDHFPHLEKALVLGNHEIESIKEYEELGFTVVESLRIEDLEFRHEPTERREPERYSICGHIHPAVRMHGAAHQSLRLACFWFGAHQAILPAFGEFTGLHTIQPKKGDHVFVIAENRVIKVE